MSQPTKKVGNGKKTFTLTPDAWAVLSALAIAVLVRIGLIHRVPW